MSRICEYSIHILPNDAIEKFENPTKREKGFLKIKGGTFLNVPDDLRIRPRAASFAKNVKSDFPTYAVVYSNCEVIDCLFVFKFIKYADGDDYYIQLTRCIGRTATKRRTFVVRDIILDNILSIMDIKTLVDFYHVFEVE